MKNLELSGFDSKFRDIDLIKIKYFSGYTQFRFFLVRLD